MNSHSWPIASPPANSAGPIERAGFTDVLVTGIDTRWIRVSDSPIAIGAKPAGRAGVGGAEDDVEEERSEHDLDQQAGQQLVAVRRAVAVAVAREAGGDRVEAVLAVGDDPQHGRGDDRGHHLDHEVGRHLAPREAPPDRQPDGHRRVEVAAGDVPDGVGHHQHAEPEGERHAEQPMPTVGKPEASTAAPQPVKTSANVPRNSAPRRRAVAGVAGAAGAVRACSGISRPLTWRARHPGPRHAHVRARL